MNCTLNLSVLPNILFLSVHYASVSKVDLFSDYTFCALRFFFTSLRVDSEPQKAA